MLITGFLVAGAASVSATRLSREDALRLQAAQAELSVIGVLQTVFPVIENFEEEVPATSNLRACVLTFADDGALRIAYAFGTYSRLEQELRWYEGQGLAGKAWEKKEVVSAPEEIALPTDLSGDPALWQLTDDQRRAIAGKSLTATAFPLIDAVGAVRAVLVLEDRRPPENSDLRRPGIRTILEQRVVTPIRDQLALTGFSFPEVARITGAS
ncbi:hypothetical protein [Streptomyces sp. NPDC003395]